jgi:hypothetical protein
MKFSQALVTAGISLLFASGLEAKELFVNSATGNDSTSYAANSSSAPWRTLGRATWGSTNRSSPNSAEAARAGDVVSITGGPFTAPSTNTRLEPAYNPANSGTSSSPITFRAIGRVELRQSGGIGPVMGSYMRNYVRWEGHFYIDETYNVPHGDTGPVVVWDTTGTVIDGCEIQGRGITYVDNHNGVRFNSAHNSTLRNCRINNIIGTTAAGDTMHHNKAGVMLYFSDGILIENNEITNSGVGIFPKGGDNFDITIRYNVLRGNNKGIRNSFSAPSRGTNRMYQNIIVNSPDLGIDLAENTNNWTIANNTLVNTGSAVWVDTTGTSGNIRIANNIISGAETAINAWTRSSAVPGPGRNVYHNASHWAFNQREYTSILSWLGVALSELGSVVANPMFVNASGGDYKLQQSSPAQIVGVDILDLNGNGSTSDVVPAGAYVRGNEIIGRNVGPVPNPPSNVTAQ